MTYDDDLPLDAGEPGRRARRVATSRAERRRRRGDNSSVRGKRRAPQPGKTVVRVIVASLASLGLLTGLGVVLVYDHWNGNLKNINVAGQLHNRPNKVKTGPKEPLNILVMGSDTRDCEGCGIDGESGGGLSDTTILVHISADRKFAYGISIPRDTAVKRPTCYREDGSEIPAATSYSKWNEAFAVGGPACTIQQLEQVSGVRVDNYVVLDFAGFKGMVNALGGVEVCIPEDIDDNKYNIHLKAGTREIKGDEALAYVRVRHSIADGTDTQRTRRQQAFIGSMLSKALTAGMLARPDKLVGFINAATASMQTDFDNIAKMVDVAASAQGIGADNIKFVTTPFTFETDKVSGGIEWTSDVEDLWKLVVNDKPLTQQFLEDSISAADRPDGSVTPSGTASGSASGTASGSASSPSSPSGSASKPGSGTTTPPSGMSSTSREDAGLCTS